MDFEHTMLWGGKNLDDSSLDLGRGCIIPVLLPILASFELYKRLSNQTTSSHLLCLVVNMHSIAINIHSSLSQ